MSRTWKIFVALFVLLVAGFSSPSEALEVELTPTISYRSGGFSCEGSPFHILAGDLLVFPPPVCAGSRAEAEDGPALGMILGVGIGKGFQLEVLVNRQETEVRRQLNFPTLDLFAPVPDADLDVTHLQVGVSKTWGGGVVRPFVAAAVGVSRVDADDPAFLTSFQEDPFSASAGAGIKTFLDERFGLRFEAREYWVDLADEFGGDFTQEELSVGAILRW